MKWNHTMVYSQATLLNTLVWMDFSRTKKQSNVNVFSGFFFQEVHIFLWLALNITIHVRFVCHLWHFDIFKSHVWKRKIVTILVTMPWTGEHPLTANLNIIGWLKCHFGIYFVIYLKAACFQISIQITPWVDKQDQLLLFVILKHISWTESWGQMQHH